MHYTSFTTTNNNNKNTQQVAGFSTLFGHLQVMHNTTT
jgi:hypothetical protein